MSPQLREPIERFGDSLSRTRITRAWSRILTRPAVSVIIPIFGAADALTAALRSIRESATPDTTEVVLVDDHSSDPAIGRVCSDFANAWPRTRLLHNPRNLGFVSTVNHGIRESAPENDVLLLNSDTQVTPGWLPRLALAAHLDDATASVCALSNAAGVFTVPKAHDDRELPADLTPARAQRVLSFVSERSLDEVPSTSGFCMLIKRRAIERVGYLDSSLFLRGYGEENDWNERAVEAGFVHRVDDSRFVHHTRGLSFGSSKEDLKRKNSRILQALHPEHAEKLRAWEKRDQLGTVRMRYGSLAEHLRDAPEVERAAFFDAPTTISIGTDASAGEWSAQERRITIARLPAGHLDVDLFGIKKVRVDTMDLADCVFEVVYRWDPARLEVRDPALRAAVSDVARVFGIGVEEAGGGASRASASRDRHVPAE